MISYDGAVTVVVPYVTCISMPEKVAATVGVPDIIPVAPFKERPLGNTPDPTVRENVGDDENTLDSAGLGVKSGNVPGCWLI